MTASRLLTIAALLLLVSLGWSQVALAPRSAIGVGRRTLASMEKRGTLPRDPSVVAARIQVGAQRIRVVLLDRRRPNYQTLGFRLESVMRRLGYSPSITFGRTFPEATLVVCSARAPMQNGWQRLDIPSLKRLLATSGYRIDGEVSLPTWLVTDGAPPRLVKANSANRYLRTQDCLRPFRVRGEVTAHDREVLLALFSPAALILLLGTVAIRVAKNTSRPVAERRERIVVVRNVALAFAVTGLVGAICCALILPSPRKLADIWWGSAVPSIFIVGLLFAYGANALLFVVAKGADRQLPPSVERMRYEEYLRDHPREPANKRLRWTIFGAMVGCLIAAVVLEFTERSKASWVSAFVAGLIAFAGHASPHLILQGRRPYRADEVHDDARLQDTFDADASRTNLKKRVIRRVDGPFGASRIDAVLDEASLVVTSRAVDVLAPNELRFLMVFRSVGTWSQLVLIGVLLLPVSLVTFGAFALATNPLVGLTILLSLPLLLLAVGLAWRQLNSGWGEAQGFRAALAATLDVKAGRELLTTMAAPVETPRQMARLSQRLRRLEKAARELGIG